MTLDSLGNNYTYISVFNNPDTLRYFFSSTFQGFASIVALGTMFYLYFMQCMDNDKIKIENKVTKIVVNNYKIQKIDEVKGIIYYTAHSILDNEKVKNENDEALNQLVRKYCRINFYKFKIKNLTPSLVRDCWILLITSLISLALINITTVINYILMGVMIFIIIFSSWFFYRMRLFIFLALGVNGKNNKEYINPESFDHLNFLEMD